MTTKETTGFERRLTWRDGLAFALVIPIAIFTTSTPAMAAVGSIGVILIIAIAGSVALLQNRLFAEMASMFPGKSGGIGLYANEAWKRRFSPVGVIASYGYWAGWTCGMGVFALAFGSLVQAQFFAESTWSVSLGSADVGLAHVIGLGTLVLSTLLNVRGVNLTIGLNKILGAVAFIMIAVIVVGPLITGDFNTSGLTFGLNAEGLEWGGFKLTMVFLFLFGWTVYGTEICVSITPEYRDQNRDVSKALLLASLLTIAVGVLVPLGLGGTLGDAAIATDPAGAYVAAFEEILGPVSILVTLVLAASMLMILNVAAADAGRALFGIASEGMGPKQLAVLNSSHQPARAIVVVSVINALLLLFVGNILGIIYAGNVGYFAAIFFAVAGFILLRRDQPNRERPVKLSAAWIPVAGIIALYTLAILVVGAANPALAGYGGRTEQVIGLVVLFGPLLLWAYRVRIQDKQPLRLRYVDQQVSATGRVTEMK